MKITKSKLEQIKKLTNRATKGPWTYTEAEVESPYNSYIARKIFCSESDSRFIAESRNTIPSLVAQIEETQEGLEDIYNMLVDCYGVDSTKNKKIAEVARAIRELKLKD